MLNLLKVYHIQGKIRLGHNFDGGYVIGDLRENYDCYISAGVSNEESFSRDFILKFNMNQLNSFAFDGTINHYPSHYTNEILFYTENINFFNDEKNTDLSFLIKKFNSIFLKMDIEGHEYLWIMSLEKEKLNKFAQIVIELHGINDNSWGSNLKTKVKCLEKLASTHYLVHAHGNNYSNTITKIPSVIELTYIHKKCFNITPEYNSQELPSPNLDYPNNPALDDINLNFPPFVTYLSAKKDLK